jgi:hypothetical protein
MRWAYLILFFVIVIGRSWLAEANARNKDRPW